MGKQDGRKQMSQMKDLSAGDLEGLACGPRHVAERYLGMRIESAAMSFGIASHKIAEAVNLSRADGKEPTREQIIALVGQAPVAASLKAVKGGMEEALLWWAEQTAGARPLDAEKHRRVELAGRWWVIKPDCVSVTEDGVLLVDDYKKGFVPPAEVARRNPRFMTYAAAARKIYGYERVESRLWNLSNKFMVRVVWEPEELDRIERYLAPEAEKIEAVHAMLQSVPEKEWPGLLDRMTPTLNDWCPSCPLGLKGQCGVFRDLLRTGQVEPGADQIQTYEIVKMAARAVSKVADTLGEALTAAAMETGELALLEDKKGEAYTAHTLRVADREAVVKTTRFKIGEFTEKHELLKDVFAKGEREEVVKRGKTFAVRSLDLGDGLTVSHQCNVDKEPKAAENAKEGQRQSLSVRRALS